MSITLIPLDDIIVFLQSNGIKPATDPKQAYMDAWNLIKSEDKITGPLSVEDWIIAYNIGALQIPLDTYNESDIRNGSPERLSNLSRILGIDDKDRIIRILKYLDKLIENLTLSYNPDIDKRILLEITDEQLGSLCLTNSY